jgi:hypothetical protein
MKKYVKPNIEVVNIKMQSLLQNSVKSVEGLNGVERGEGDFGGGARDSRGSYWEDDEY